jgi:hypothetical protein
MLDQTMYNILSTIFYLFFAIIWKSSNATNVFIKISCIILGIVGGILTFKEFGYIIKV